MYCTPCAIVGGKAIECHIAFPTKLLESEKSGGETEMEWLCSGLSGLVSFANVLIFACHTSTDYTITVCILLCRQIFETVVRPCRQ
ncbi:hypothetical protein SAMN05421740_112122 [Parapedobacter koreensis]|uniref:Uncharacterized protein n=1 Tax=Parapedobacter koreensis TaxID=332977 RepID=A0A1H7TWN9_9SPHI|nr:hypothetical protein SAMN05421740_112122 [Parapedobacter koreensis]